MNDRLVLALPDGARSGVVWYAPLLNFSGYADEARAFVLGLRARGADLRAEAIGDPSAAFVNGLDPEMKAALDDAMRTPRAKHAVHVLHMPGQTLTRLPGASYHVARSMFETDGLPAAWVPRLNEMDEVWVPTAFNVETFRAAGVRVPLHVVPGGVHPDAFANATPLPIDGLRSTVFLSVFEWSFRKGWDVLLRAWAKAFSSRDDVTLLLRTYPMKRPGSTITAADIERQINTFLGNLGTSRKRVAPIVVLHEPVADADMPRLYATASAYVSPTRGEGWGRPMLEAMAAGLPVIATRWSAHLEFMNDDNSLLLDIEGLEKVDQREELDFYRGQSWALPSARHLTKLFLDVASDPAKAAAVGQRAQSDVAQHWSWTDAVDIASARLDAIAANLRRATPKPTATPVRWVGEQYSLHSLAHVNRELCGRLIASDELELELATRENDSDRALRGGEVAGLETRTGDVLDRPARVEVRHQWPPDWRAPRQGAWVVMQPWEFGGLPDEWVAPLSNEVDEVWCYTNFVRDSYLASGIPAEKLRVIPLGVDTRVFAPEGPSLGLRTQKRTRLLFVGGTIERKGIDVLLDAYTATFTAADDVCLVIKSSGASTVYEHNAIDDRIRALAADPLTAEIELVTEDLSREEIAALYRACDALVHPYRGEGFGLPIAEAMASGLPVVVTDYGAARDFCDADSAFLIPATVVPVPAGGLTPNTAGYWWAEPDAAVLCEVLRRLVDDPIGARSKAARALQRVRSELSWDAAASVIEQRLVELSTVVPARFCEPGNTVPVAAGSQKRSGFVLTGATGGLVSACMIVRDEADKLADCLAALDGLVDEIVVYDTGSVDETVEVARAAGATLIEGTWSDDFATARNAALAACTGEWVLWVDADEILLGDRPAFRAVLAASPPVDAVQLVIDNLDGAGAVIGHSHRATRVFRRDRGHWAGRLHEEVVAQPGQRELREGVTTHVRFLHTGYQDTAIQSKGKSERNIRLAEAELAEGTNRRGLVLVHLGRSLTTAGRLEEALARFEEALGVTDKPGERRLALRHGAEALLDIGRPQDALSWIDRLRDASERHDMADYLAGIAYSDLGEIDTALRYLTPLLRVLDDDGFALPDHVLRLRRASVLRDAQRWGDAADELLSIASAELAPPWATLAELNWRAGRDADVVAGVIRPGQITAAMGQLLAAPPEVTDGVADALLRRWPDDPAVLAGAAVFAAQLSPARALEWSARLRPAGLADRCPLMAIATDAERSVSDRVQATCLLSGAFRDARATDAVRALAPEVPEDELLTALVQMGELSPTLLPEFVLAAATGGARTVAVAGCLDELGAPEAAEELLAMAAS